MGSHDKSDRENLGQPGFSLDDPNQRDEAIAAYVEGELAPEETASFERRLEADDALRHAVEDWREAIEAARDWIDAEAPGVGRVADLAIPSVADRAADGVATRSRDQARRSAARLITLGPLLLRAAVAAAIFAIGFYLGHANRQPPATSEPDRPRIQPVNVQQTPKAGTPAPAERQSPAQYGREIARRPSRRYSTDDRGRVVVETTVGESNAYALFVIDRSFRIGQ